MSQTPPRRRQTGGGHSAASSVCRGLHSGSGGPLAASSVSHGGGCRGTATAVKPVGYIGSGLHRRLPRQPPPYVAGSSLRVAGSCRWHLDSEQRAAGRQCRATILFSCMSRFSLDFILMRKWKNQRRRRTQRSLLRCIVSSGSPYRFWP